MFLFLFVSRQEVIEELTLYARTKLWCGFPTGYFLKLYINLERITSVGPCSFESGHVLYFANEHSETATGGVL